MAEMTIDQAAKKLNICRQTIFNAIVKKSLKGIKKKTSLCRKAMWFITDKDLKEYLKNRRDRSRPIYKGELIFDKSKGLYSVKDTANILGCSNSYVYTCVNNDLLKAHRKNSSWVIHVDDIKEFKKNAFLNKQGRRTYEKEGNFRALIRQF